MIVSERFKWSHLAGALAILVTGVYLAATRAPASVAKAPLVSPPPRGDSDAPPPPRAVLPENELHAAARERARRLAPLLDDARRRGDRAQVARLRDMAAFADRRLVQ